MLRGRNTSTPTAQFSGANPSDPPPSTPSQGSQDYSYDTSYEADTPTSHYSTKVHSDDYRHLNLALGLGLGSGSGPGSGPASTSPSPSLPGTNPIPSSSILRTKSAGADLASTANSSFDMDRGWGADKGYAHEYEESSVGGATPKVGLGIGMGGMERASGGRRQNSGAGLGIFGKGKKKRLGLPQRAWMVLMVLASLILISEYVFPSDSRSAPPPVDPHQSSHILTPRDYLNASRTDPAPFDFCPVFGPGDAIAARRGQFELLKSRLHLGTGARVQRVLQKAMSGGAVTMSVLGGSVSACMGAGDDPISPSCYPSKFFNWWNSVFPHPANELTNGATRKTDSAYYAYCNSHHMPDKSDLVLLEFDAADPNDPEWLSHFELLVRSVLVRPEMPAVIVLGHFSPQVQAQNGFAGPELLHNVVAQFYDVPHISVKGLLYDSYLRTPEHALSAFYNGPLHANANGHDLIADVLISYMMSQICAGWSTLQGHEFSVPALGAGNLEGDGSASGGPSLLGGVGLRKGIPGQDPGDGDSAESALKVLYDGMRVPNMRLNDLPNDVEKFREIEPFCVSASDLINPLPPSLFYGSGWHTYAPPKNALTEDRHYWYADIPTARLRIPLRLGAGDVGIYFLQSPPDKPLGVAKCWVDDNFAGGKELHGTADVEEVIATLIMIDRGVSRGSHFVECQLQGEAGGSSAPFKILGVFTT